MALILLLCFKLITHSTVGFIKHELIFTAYCRDNLFRRMYKGGSFAYLHKLDSGRFGRLQGIILVHDSE